MSLSGFKVVTEKFLSTPKAEVLCIRGAWGIGKTFAWKQAIDRARDAGTVPLESYAYVSLFGINSLDELKQAIFDQSVVRKSAGLDASLETFDELVETTKGLGSWLVRTVGTVAAHTGAAARFVGNIGPALFLSVRNRIICIDDLERRGEKLKVGDVLGLISMLKEQRGCKIVLLLNDQAIEGEERHHFDAYLEKVVDASFHFNPSPADSSLIAFPDRSGIHARTAELCIKLGIKNIRILGKIKNFVEEMEPSLKDFDNSLLDQAISTIVLLCWVVYDSSNAPSIDYLRKRNAWNAYVEERKKEMTPQVLGWEEVLQDYGFGQMDELDSTLLDGIQNGLFDAGQIAIVAKDLHASAIAKKGEQAFHDAWAPYHNSFDVDQDRFLDGLYRSFKENCRYISPNNVAGTISLFKDLGRPEDATELLKVYTDAVEDPKLIDMDECFWASEIKEPEVIAAFRARHKEMVPPVDPVATFHRMVENGQYNSYDMKIATQLSSLEIEQALLSLRDQRARDARKWISTLKNSVFADKDHNDLKLQLQEKVMQALESIADRSAANRRRISDLLGKTN